MVNTMKIQKYDKVQEFCAMLRSAIKTYEKTDRQSAEFSTIEERVVSYFDDTIEVARREIFFCQSGITAMASQIKAISDQKTSKNELRQDIERVRNKQISLSNLLKKLKEKVFALGLENKVSSLNKQSCQLDKERDDNLFDGYER